MWLASSVTWLPAQVFVDGARLTPSTSSPESLSVNAFTWVSGQGLYVNLVGGNPGARQILVGHRAHGFHLFSKAWVTIEGFDIARTEDRGISIHNGCTDLVIARNRVSFANSYGIQSVNGLRVLIDENVVSDCNFHGIGLTGGATRCVVRNNESFRNAKPGTRVAKGIYLNGAPNNTLVGNWLHHNQDTGLQINSGSNDCIVYNNQSWSNGDHGYDHLDASGTIHLNNVAYGNYKDGFSIEANSPNTQLYNCIAIENGLTTDEFDLWVNDQSSVGFVSDHNIFWNSADQEPIKFIATKFASLADYRAASGLDAHSLQADPMFVDGPAGNFVLLPGSPAIDAGTSNVPFWPATDAVGNTRMDDSAVPDHGAGPLSYVDIGALEFRYSGDFAPIPLPTTPGTVDEKRHASIDAGGASTLQGTAPTALALSSGFPNPSRGAVEFALDLPQASRVAWAVFDLQGRRVWSENRELGAGRVLLHWQGATPSGAPAGTGVYLLRAWVDDVQLTRRVVRY